MQWQLAEKEAQYHAGTETPLIGFALKTWHFTEHQSKGMPYSIPVEREQYLSKAADEWQRLCWSLALI